VILLPRIVFSIWRLLPSALSSPTMRAKSGVIRRATIPTRRSMGLIVGPLRTPTWR